MSTTGWGYVLIITALLLWAGNAVIGRLAPEAHVPPLGLNFWRWTVALLVLAPFALPRLSEQRQLFRDHWRLWATFGVITVAGFNSVYYIGLQHTTVIQATLISTILPILVLVGARVFLAQPITGRQLAGVVVSMTGVALIVARGDHHVLRHLVFNVGDLCVLAAVVIWAVQTILIRFLPRGMDVIAFQVAGFVPGLAILAPLYAYETATGHPMPLSTTAVLFVAYAGLFASVAGFTFWNLGVVRIGPKAAGYLTNLFPVFGAAFGILLLGEPFRWFHAVGGLITLAGVYLATTAPRPRA
jgi:drug/metabolite transporter (DMT)-like permease